MKNGCIRFASYGCLSCIVVILFLFLFIVIYTYSGENLYYIEDDNMYVSFKKCRGNEVYVYFGKTVEDVDNKLDGYKVQVRMLDNHYIWFIKDCTKDSIFLIQDVETTTILSSTHFVFVPLPPIIEEVTCYDLNDNKSIELRNRGYDETRFRNNPNNYKTFFYNKDKFWHQMNSLMILYHEYTYIDPIER